jgi:hypothetical protein
VIANAEPAATSVATAAFATISVFDKRSPLLAYMARAIVGEA